MAFRVLADAVLVLHFAFVLFVVFGGFFVLRWSWVAWVHVPAAGWGAWVEFAGWICPLTPLENWLRERSGAPGYASSFLDRYLLPALYPSSLTQEVQAMLGGLVVVVNVVVYWAVFRRGARVGR